MVKHVVKRKGHVQQYDEKKVYACSYAAALNCHCGEKEAEKIAAQITAKVNAWIKSRKAVKSEEIRAQILANMNPEMALMYKHHLDVC